MADSDEPINEASPTVLVVEDDVPLLEFFSALLKREGYNILVAANGVEALALASEIPDAPIDVLLSDVAMPYMNGTQLAERMKQIRPNIRVFLISGLPYQEVVNRSGPSFSVEFLPKPFSVSELSGKVRQLATSV